MILSGKLTTTPDELLDELELLLDELELLLELLLLELLLLELLDEPPGPPDDVSPPQAARPRHDPMINRFIIFIVSSFSQKHFIE